MIRSDTLETFRSFFIAQPLLVDIDGDGDLEIIATSYLRDIDAVQQGHRIDVFDHYLTKLERFVFPNERRILGGAMPAVDDIDLDGVCELCFASPEGVLHVLKIGTAAGDAPWPQAHQNSRQTNVAEQPMEGTYDQSVSILGRVRITNSVTFSERLFVDPAARIRIDTLAASPDTVRIRAMGGTHLMNVRSDTVRVISVSGVQGTPTWGGLIIRDPTAQTDTIRHVRIDNADVGITGYSPLHVDHVTISDAATTGLHVEAPCTLSASSIRDSAGRGVYAGLHANLRIVNSTISAHEAYGVVCDTCSLMVVGSQIEDNGSHGIKLSKAMNFPWIRECVVSGNGGDGIRCEDSSPRVVDCTLEGNSAGIECWYSSDPLIAGTSIRGNGGGVFATQNSFPVVGTGGSPGHNCIENSSSHHIVNLSDPYTPIYAEYNYWGATCCPQKKFFGLVQCSNCDVSPACWSPPAYVVTLLETAPSAPLPDRLDLGLGYPNPFNPVTRVPYQVPPPGADVSIVVYNVRGQRVRELVRRYVDPGFHEVEWDGSDTRGGHVASGVYFVRMLAPGFAETMKLVVLK